jgi:Tol biopolymer transport system component
MITKGGSSLKKCFLVISAVALAWCNAATPLRAGAGEPVGPTVHDRWPAFSPDSASIAFERSQGMVMDVYVISLYDGSERRITQSPAGMLSMSPAWFPSGNLLYTTTSPQADFPDGSLFETRAAAAGDPRRIGPAGARARSISPNGRAVLFLTKDWAIAEMDVVSGAVKVLSKPPSGTWDTEASWSPDGRQIAFGCNYDPKAAVPRSDICIMNANGSGRHIIVGRTDCAEWVTWSPDGTHIAFQADRKNFTAGSIIVADVATGDDVVDISKNTGYALNETPAWSPDGKWIAFQVKTPNGYRIAVEHPDGSGFRLVT